MKHLNFKGFIIACLVCSTVYVKAQTTPAATTPAGTAAAKPAAVAPKGAAALIDAFFKKYKDDGTGPAVDYLFATNKYFTNTNGINQLKTKLDSLRSNIGAYLGKDLIVTKTASNSLVYYSYLVKHEIQPIRFTFMFYKPQNDWVLYRFKYDDQMDAELEEAGKISNKHP